MIHHALIKIVFANVTDKGPVENCEKLQNVRGLDENYEKRPLFSRRVIPLLREKAHLWKCTILQKLRFILSVKNINDCCVQLRFWNLIRGRSSRGNSLRWMLLYYYYLFSIWKISCNTDDVVKVPHKWLKNSGKWPTLSLSNVMSRNPICIL